jgi:phage baseplate assembly protein W
MAMKRGMFGAGLSFPPRVGSDGRLAWSRDEQNVLESIRILLLTEPGERVMRESVGCGLRRFLFEPNTEATRAAIRERIVRAIAEFEPRVVVQQVDVDAGADPRLVNVSIEFRLVVTQVVQRLGLTVALEG